MPTTSSLPLAKNGVFRTIQGEGALLGLPMTFIRLAGCSVGCSLCDTDYAVSRRASPIEIVLEVSELTRRGEWVWITGGEPLDHDISELVSRLSDSFDVALATSGHASVSTLEVKFLSVSPHSPDKWVQKWGSEIKIVPGLNGYRLSQFSIDDIKFDHCFVSPCEGDADSRDECVRFVEEHPGWRMTTQAHKYHWRMV